MLAVRGDDRLRAVVLALKAARRDVKNEIARATRQTMNPVWRDAVAKNARTDLDRKVIAQGARIAAGNPPVAYAAQSKRRLHGGLVPVERWHAVEFGANPNEVTTYDRKSPKGGKHDVTRHTQRQLPPRYRKGRVAYPALKEFVPRLTSLWVQIVVRVFNEAVEKGER